MGLNECGQSKFLFGGEGDAFVFSKFKPQRGCLFIAGAAALFHLLFFSGARACRAEISHVESRAAEKQKEGGGGVAS